MPVDLTWTVLGVCVPILTELTDKSYTDSVVTHVFVAVDIN